MKRLFVREIDGDYNLDVPLDGKPLVDLADAVDKIFAAGGYTTTTRAGNHVFVPWHRICYLRESEEQ